MVHNMEQMYKKKWESCNTFPLILRFINILLNHNLVAIDDVETLLQTLDTVADLLATQVVDGALLVLAVSQLGDARGGIGAGLGAAFALYGQFGDEQVGTGLRACQLDGLAAGSLGGHGDGGLRGHAVEGGIDVGSVAVDGALNGGTCLEDEPCAGVLRFVLVDVSSHRDGLATLQFVVERDEDVTCVGRGIGIVQVTLLTVQTEGVVVGVLVVGAILARLAVLVGSSTAGLGNGAVGRLP